MNQKRLNFCLDMRAKYPEICSIHDSVVVPEWVSIGKNVSIHAGVILGSDGFGYQEDNDGNYLHIPHIGRVVIEDDVEIFEGSNVSRATIDETRIGKGTKIDVLCHVGHNVKIGKNCIITGHCVIGGGCVIGDGVYIGLNSTIKNKIRITDGVFIGQGANVVKDILEPNTVWAGNPARLLKRKGDDDGDNSRREK
jgi:UDP-3-O-[3-hydroxymyristoyl] glucosamine N-acyltransferase